MGVAHHLATELDAAAVGELDLLDPAADPGPRLQHRDLRPAGLQVARGGQPGQTGAHDHDVRTAHRGPCGSVGPSREALPANGFVG